MKYEIRIFAIGENPNDSISISEDEFSLIKKSKLVLSAGLAIEEKYEVLLTNYEDFEKEILDSTLESLLRGPSDYSDFRPLTARCNIKIINLLTASRLYVDHIMQLVHDIIPVEREGMDLINQFCSEQYDNNLEYRFMERLRNYVQHNAFPINETIVKDWVVRNDNSDRKMASTIELVCDKKKLEESDFHRAILVELGDRIYLKPMIRKYIECLSEVQSKVRSIVSDRLSGAREKITEYINRFRNEVNVNANGLFAFAYDENRRVQDKIPILLNWDDLRISLENKNRILINLSKCYVTGEVKKDK